MTIETRCTWMSHETGWLVGARRYPHASRFRSLKSIVVITTRTESRGKVTEHTRYFVCPAVLTPERAVDGIRGRWGIESMQWVLDVVCKETGRASAAATAPAAWLSFGASPSISCVPAAASDQSKPPENDGTRTSSQPFSTPGPFSSEREKCARA